MKRVLSLIMVLAMVLSMVPAVFAAEVTAVELKTVTAEADSKDATTTYKPTVDGTLTVTVGDGSTNWSSDVMYFDASFSPVVVGSGSGTAEGSYSVELTAGTTYRIRVWETSGAALAATPLKATFTPAGEEDFGEKLTSGTATCTYNDSWGEYVPAEVTITAPANGTVTVKATVPTDNTGADQIAWKCEALTVKFPEVSTTDGIYQFDVYNGLEYTVAIGAFDAYEEGDVLGGHTAHWDNGTVNYEIYFEAGEVELEDHVVSGHVPMDVVDEGGAMKLYYTEVGENREYTATSDFSGESVEAVSKDYVLEADPTAVVTIFAFEPAMDGNGVYKFTAPEGVKLTYWGQQSALPVLQEKDAELADNVIYATVDNGCWNLCKPTENMAGTPTEDETLWYWLWSSSQMLIGVEGATGEVTLTATKTDALPSEVKDTSGEDTPNYSIKHGFATGFYNLADDAVLEAVNLEEDHTAVKGDDGYYHLDTVDGPIVYVDTETAYISLSTLINSTALNVTYVNDDGEEVKENFGSAMRTYANKLEATDGIYPLTRDLEIFLSNYGWQTDLEALPYDYETADANTALMSVCRIVAGTAGEEEKNELVIGQNEIAVPAAGVTYTWIAEKAGTFTLNVDSFVAAGGYEIIVYKNGTEVAFLEPSEVAAVSEEADVTVEVAAGDVITVEAKTLDADYEYADGTVNMTAAFAATPVFVEKEIVFNLGANGSATHNDGNVEITADAPYTETNGDYTLTIDTATKTYQMAIDAMGNSCIKMGTSSKTASFTFVVPENVNKVIIAVAKYKTNATIVDINGTEYTISTASNDGAYTNIEVDTSTNKTVTVATTSSGKRAMINTITYVALVEDTGCTHTNTTTTVVEATCTTPGSTTVTCECGEVISTETTAATGHTYVYSETAITCEDCDYNAAYTLSTIQAAKEAAASDTATVFYLKGIVTYASGKNVYIEDATGGICVYCADYSNNYNISVGDEILVWDTLKTYNGLIETAGTNDQEFIKLSSDNEVPVKEVTLADLKADSTNEYLGEHVKIVNVTIGAINTSGNTALSDAEGNSINIYKVPTLADTIAEGDAVTVTAIVSTYNGYQLLVASADDVVEYVAPEEPTLPSGEFSVGTYESYYWEAPATGTVTFTVTPADAVVGVDDNNWQNVTTIDAGSASFAVEEGVEYTVYDAVGYGTVAFDIAWKYTEVTSGGEDGGDEEINTTLTLGDNTLVGGNGYSYIPTEDGTLTISFVSGSADIGSLGTNPLSGSYFNYGYLTLVVNEQDVEGSAMGVASIPVSAGVPVAVSVNVNNAAYSNVQVVMNLAMGSGDEGGDETNTLSLGDNAVEVAAGLTPGSWTYTATEAGTLTVTVSALSVDGEAVDAAYLANQFAMGQIYLTVNGAQVASNTTDVVIAADDVVTVEMSHSTGSALAGTINLALSAGSEGGEDEGDGDGDGSASNPWVIKELPWSWTITGNHDNYFKYTPAEDCTLIITRTEGGLVSGLPGYEEDENGNYIVQATAGETITLNPWTMSAEEVEYTYTMAVQGGNVDPSEPDGSVENPYIIESLPFETEITLTAENCEAGLHYKYTVPEGMTQVQIDYVDGVISYIYGNYDYVEDANGNRIYPVEPGSTFLIETYSWNACTYTFKVSEWVAPSEPDGSVFAPYIIDSLPTTLTVELDGQSDVYYEYTATEAGAVAAESDGAMVGIMVNGEYPISEPATYAAGDVLTINVGSWWEGTYEVKLYDPTVAKIGDVIYTDLSTALEAAQSGDTVTLVADAEVDYAVITPGVTLDLGSYTLTADYVIGLNGSGIVATAMKVTNGVMNEYGKLVVDPDNISLASNAPDGATAGYKMIPVWNEDHYCFSLAGITKQEFAVEASNDGKATIKFQGNFTSYVKNNLFADNGSGDNGMSVIVRVSYTETLTNGKDVKVTREYYYTEELIQDMMADDKLTASLIGCDALKDLVFSIAFVTEAGVEVVSQDYVYADYIQ